VVTLQLAVNSNAAFAQNTEVTISGSCVERADGTTVISWQIDNLPADNQFIRFAIFKGEQHLVTPGNRAPFEDNRETIGYVPPEGIELG
jgi:hypothetical protein